MIGIPFAEMKTNFDMYSDQSYKPGSTVKYACMNGAIYDELSGPLLIKCDQNGKWSSYKLPQCICKI